LLVVLLTLGCAEEYKYKEPDWEQLKRQGDPLVAAIQDFEQQHGRPPKSFEECGLAAPKSLFGPWRYYVGEDGSSWGISVGHYERDGFVLYWDDSFGEWMEDQ